LKATDLPKKALWRLGFGRKRRNPKSFPDGIYKTDETRLQAMPEILDHMRGLALYATEKLDGCSATYFARRLPRHWLLEASLGQTVRVWVCAPGIFACMNMIGRSSLETTVAGRATPIGKWPTSIIYLKSYFGLRGNSR
jgi:hypothetical protein